MAIDKEVLRRMFQRAAARLHGESDHLSEIDSRFGDGDHGITMDKIASLMQDLTTAKVGDKTMMDALIPAVKAAQEAAGDDPAVVMEAAAAAAAQGAKDTENYVSKFGRAKSYKEQTLGTPDAGAVSTSVLLAGLAEGIRG